MNKNFLLVDGYNIIHAWDNLKEMSEVSLESARAKLMEIMSNYQGFKSHITVIVVFDGYLVKEILALFMNMTIYLQCTQKRLKRRITILKKQ